MFYLGAARDSHLFVCIFHSRSQCVFKLTHYIDKIKVIVLMALVVFWVHLRTARHSQINLEIEQVKLPLFGSTEMEKFCAIILILMAFGEVRAEQVL